MPSNKPILSMRVYPEGRSLYYLVNVWPTKKAMQEHCRTVNGYVGRNYAALVNSFHVSMVGSNGRTRTGPIMGEINFNRKALGGEIVAHEMTHAALGWARRIKLNFDGILTQSGGACCANEERFCYALGSMARQFINRAYEIGIY